MKHRYFLRGNKWNNERLTCNVHASTHEHQRYQGDISREQVTFIQLIYFTEVPTVDVDFYLAQTYIIKPVANILVTKSFIAIK